MTINFNKAEFMLSATTQNAFIRDGRPQVTFAGRSNVGKSSVINRLLNRKNFARVGATPGKTSQVNYFRIDGKLYFTDLPGYGYAKVSKEERDRWGRLMESYFQEPGLISLGVLIVDARHKPSADDVTMCNWFREAGCPMLVVANKMDLPDAEENYKKLEAYVTAQGYPIMKASAATGQGLREIMWKAYEMLQKAPAEEEIIDIGKVDEADPDSFTILRDTEDADFEVKGKNIERLVAMTNFDNEEAVYRFQLIWRRLGIEKALKEKGIQEGQSVKIGDMVFDYQEQ